MAKSWGVYPASFPANAPRPVFTPSCPYLLSGSDPCYRLGRSAEWRLGRVRRNPRPVSKCCPASVTLCRVRSLAGQPGQSLGRAACLRRVLGRRYLPPVCRCARQPAPVEVFRDDIAESPQTVRSGLIGERQGRPAGREFRVDRFQTDPACALCARMVASVKGDRFRQSEPGCRALVLFQGIGCTGWASVENSCPSRVDQGERDGKPGIERVRADGRHDCMGSRSIRHGNGFLTGLCRSVGARDRA